MGKCKGAGSGGGADRGRGAEGGARGTIAFLPRFTTLIGATSFTTMPIDATRLGSVQLQVWRGDLLGTTPTFAVYIEESQDGEVWTQGPSVPAGYDPGAGEAQFFSYCFQLRWFRLRVDLGGTAPRVTCWAEGILR